MPVNWETCALSLKIPALVLLVLGTMNTKINVNKASDNKVDIWRIKERSKTADREMQTVKTKLRTTWYSGFAHPLDG